jgi:hypothetical protein
VCDTATTTPAYSARSFASRLARGLCADVTTGRWVSSKLAAHCMRPKNQYLLSLPERALRSASALAAGLVREIGNVTLPKAVRRTRLYQTMVETTLRFLIEQVGRWSAVIRRKADWPRTSCSNARSVTASISPA